MNFDQSPSEPTAFPQGYYPTERKISRENREDGTKRVKSARTFGLSEGYVSGELLVDYRARARARGRPSNDFSRECQPQDLILPTKPTRGRWNVVHCRGILGGEGMMYTKNRRQIDIEIERITPSPDRSKFH